MAGMFVSRIFSTVGRPSTLYSERERERERERYRERERGKERERERKRERWVYSIILSIININNNAELYSRSIIIISL